MVKKNNTPKTKLRPHSLAPIHDGIIARFIEEKGMLSNSDVVRQALVFFHDKTFPDYVYRETPAGEEKKKKLDEDNKFKKMSDEQYAEDIKAPVFTAETGIKFALVHGVANSLKAIPLQGIKDKLSNDPVTVKTHLSTLALKTIAEQLSPYVQELLYDDYAIRIPESFFEKKE